jgi:hypothetical protein
MLRVDTQLSLAAGDNLKMSRKQKLRRNARCNNELVLCTEAEQCDNTSKPKSKNIARFGKFGHAG